MIRIILALILALSILGCGPSSKDQLQTRMAEVKLALHNLKQGSANDRNTLAFLKECEGDLEKVHGLLVEGEVEKSRELLEAISAQIERFDPLARSDLAGPVSVMGNVEYLGPGMDTPSSLTDRIDPAQIRKLQTGIRSVAEIQFSSGVLIKLSDQSEVQIDNNAHTQTIKLIKGVVSLSQPAGANTRIIIDLFQGDLSGDAEIGLAWLSNTRYVSAYRGAISWKELASEGRLTAQKGLLWTNDGARREIDLPLAPMLEQPVVQNGQTTFYWSKMGDETFQIQISENQMFSTRIFDKSGLSSDRVKTALPPGNYFWRVRGLSPDFVPGPWSKVQKYSIRDGEAPQQIVKNATKPGPPLRDINLEVISDMVIVSGFTGQNARVTVNNISAFVDSDGSFRVLVNFTTGGTHKVQVLATDPENGAETIKNYDVEINIH